MPLPCTVKVAPLLPPVVQVASVVLAKVTGLPLAPLTAVRPMVVPCAWLNVVGGVKPVMVCVALLIVMLAVTCAAAWVVVSPAWSAVSEHVPAATMVSVAPLVPLVVQMLGLVAAKLTGKPDEVVAVSVIVFPGAEAVNVIGEAGVKPVMV